MFNFTRISAEQAHTIRTESLCNIVDIRDEASYQAGHIPTAVLLDNANIQTFVDTSDQNLPVLVYCYHGNSSQQAAQFLASQGFKEAYSVDGGYAHWATFTDS